MASNVIPLNPRVHTRDIIKAAIAEGKPLPLEVMMENLVYWYSEARELSTRTDSESQSYARLARANAQRVAEAAAPYLHAKLSAVAVSGDQENPVTIHHHVSHERIRQLTDEQATKLLEQLDAGEITVDDLAREILP